MDLSYRNTWSEYFSFTSPLGASPESCQRILVSSNCSTPSNYPFYITSNLCYKLFHVWYVLHFCGFRKLIWHICRSSFSVTTQISRARRAGVPAPTVCDADISVAADCALQNVLVAGARVLVRPLWRRSLPAYCILDSAVYVDLWYDSAHYIRVAVRVRCVLSLH